MALLTANVALARNYYVSTTGNDSNTGSVGAPIRTVAKAASLMAAGDTTFVYGGTYSEKNILPAASGTESARMVFKPMPTTGTVILKHPATDLTDNTPIFNLSNRNFIWIEGFRFSDYQFGKAAISMNNSQNNVVINNRFVNLGNGSAGSWDQNSMIWVYQSSRNVVRNNMFENIFGDGISLNGQQSINNLVCENTFQTFKGKLRSWGGTSLFSRAIDVQDMSYGNNVIAFNLASGVYDHIWLDRDGSTNVMLRNVGKNSQRLVFNESRCARNIIQENIGYGLTTAFQTATYDGTGWTFDGRWVNNVAFNNQTGFYVHKAERSEFRNNIAFNNTKFNLVFTDSARSREPNIFENNLWLSESLANSIQLGSTPVAVSKFQSSMGEMQGLSVNPQFAGTASGSENFTLLSASPAQNAGDKGQDLGAYAVYGPTSVGWDSTVQISKRQVYFDLNLTLVNRGSTVQLVVRLDKASSEQISVDLVPVAGDAVQGVDFQLTGQTIQFEPGTTSKTVTVSTGGLSEHVTLVAFKLSNANNAQAGARMYHILEITAMADLKAKAGPDQSIREMDKRGNATVFLQGGRSYIPTGTNATYTWSESGVVVATGANPAVTLPVGVHALTLNLADGNGKSSTDEVIINIFKDSGIWLEAECGTVGTLWNIETDPAASNAAYATIKPGNTVTSAPTDATGFITLPFTLTSSGTYSLWARTWCPTSNDDSFFLKMDNGTFATWNGITNSSSWTWVKYPTSFGLTAGSHTLTIAYREDGTKLDKIWLTTESNPEIIGIGSKGENIPTAIMGEKADRPCVFPNPVTDVLHVTSLVSGSDLQLFNKEGMLVFHQKATSDKAELTLSRLVPGIYFLKITHLNGSQMVKIIKR